MSKKYTCSSGKNYAAGGRVEESKPTSPSFGKTDMSPKNFGSGGEAKPSKKGKC